MKKRILCVFAMLMLVASCALAQSTYVFPYEGIRYTQGSGETVLTQTNLDEHSALIASLGTTTDAILSSYMASGIVMEVIPQEGGQIAVSVAKNIPAYQLPPDVAREAMAFVRANKGELARYALSSRDALLIAQGMLLAISPELFVRLYARV